MRRQALLQDAEATRECLDSGDRWIERLDDHRKRRRWRPAKQAIERYENVQRSVRASRFRLGQGESEGDLDAVKSARDEACAARDELVDIGRSAGVDPPS